MINVPWRTVLKMDAENNSRQMERSLQSHNAGSVQAFIKHKLSIRSPSFSLSTTAEVVDLAPLPVISTVDSLKHDEIKAAG